MKKNLDERVTFDQMIVNEYERGQGINPHVDNCKLFGGTVVSLSLASEAVMVFEREHSKVETSGEGDLREKPSKKVKADRIATHEVRMKRRSLVILQGPARYLWKHSIPARLKDHGVERSTRLSLTFRTII